MNIADDKIRLSRTHKGTLYAVIAVLWITGILWLIPFLLVFPDGYDFPRTGLQSLSMKIHGAFAFLACLLLGSLYGHVRRAWPSGRNRKMGLVLILIFSLLIVSAWILYYLASDSLRLYSSYIHWLIGVFLPLLILFHLKTGKQSRGAKKNS